MPFEIAPQTEEQQRQILGRIALGAIADYILTVPPENFDMAHWCGTACCAIGHGVKLPEVQATGLRLAQQPDGYVSTQSHYPVFGDDSNPLMGGPAIAAAFGIEVHQAAGLFNGFGCGITTEQVSARIRQFLAGEILQDNPARLMTTGFPGMFFTSSSGTTITWTGGQTYTWMGVDECRAPTVKPARQPAKKVRVSAKNGATWPVAKGCYA